MNFKTNTQIAEVEIFYKSNIKAADRVKVISSKDTYNVLKNTFNPDKIEHREQFIILLLNRANHVLGWCNLSEGGTSGTVVEVKMIFQLALKANASGIILSHNHPSGQLIPSEQDRIITRKVKDCGKILDISVLDHLIVTSENYYSFADEGLM